MKKNNTSLKDTFIDARKSYSKRDFKVAENLCQKILSIDPDHLDSIILLSNIFAHQRDYKKAKEFLNKAKNLSSNNITVLNNLGTACKYLGELKEAADYYKQVIKLDPENTNANYNLGAMCYDLKQLKHAKNYLQKATMRQPDFAIAFLVLGNVQKDLKEYENAISSYQKALSTNSNLISAHNNLGLVYRILNDFENAINSYKKAIEIKKDYVSAYHNLALALKESGNFSEAIKSHETAIKYEPENLIHYFYLYDLKKDILNEDLKKKVNQVLQNKNISKNNAAHGNYLLSKYENKENNHEKELSFLEKGHQYYFESRKEKFEIMVKYNFDDMIKISNEIEVENSGVKKENFNIKPIFIIGVPRCGSTLVEKIIGSGADSIPMGEETGVLEEFITSTILKKQSLNLGNVNNIREEILNIYKQRGLISEKYKNIFTDKSLNNFFFLKFIRIIFPNAKIINCRRDVLSSIVSIFQNNLTEIAWAHNLDNIFKYFNNYFEIIDSYNESDSKFIYQLKFNELINNPEEESKKLMNFCGLTWDKKCLEFYKRQDVISKTASNVQIRKKIYKHPAEKYEPYKKLLKKYGENYIWFK